MADSNRPESGGVASSRPDLHHDGPLEIDLTDVVIRRSDGDDCQILEQVIDPQTQDLLDLLYNYPRLIQRVEACYLSITIIDSQYRVIGMAIFEDFPQGLEGMYDYLHENSWEQWLQQAFSIREEFDIRPFNSLWLVYFYLDRKNFRIDPNQETELLRMVFQNVYATNPNIEGINFLLRGDVVDEVGTPEAVKSILNKLFVQIPAGDTSALKKVRGIQPSSQLFYSPRQKCFEYVEIRIAKQEDHDDLAEIFNKQSEVLTTQFGEFFIAELIAFQNENQKALVAQVDDRAVGLMSISKDIDYKLLAEGFELEQYDNLLRAEFMEAVKDRKDDIVLQQHYEEVDRRREAEKKILEEKMLTSHWGQRISLQQHLRAKETKIKDEMIGFTSNEELNKTLTREIVEGMLDEWLAEFKLTQPGDIFSEQNVKDPEINCWVISERNFFLETLTYFGLPKDYLQGNGHWHDWAYIKLQERKQALLRKAPKKQKQPVRRAGRGRPEEKKEEELKEPEYFDLMPLQRSFDRFMAASPDVRTTLRNTILDNMKKFVLIFSDENGELLKGRNVDVTELGDYLKEAGINLPAAQWEYIPYILDCFGELKFDKKVTKVMPQDEKAKREELKDVKSKKLPAPLLALKDAKKGKETKKQEEPKEPPKEAPKQPPKEDKEKETKEEFKADPKTASPETQAKKEVDPGIEKLSAMVRANDIVEMFSAFEEILIAIEKVKAFDQMMMKLGVIKEETVKDPTLKTEVKDLEEKAVQDREEELRNRERNLPENPWRDHCSNLDDLNVLPIIPPDAHNAIAINLFCIDENYESRSIDFLEYAFNLFPDRDYIILTQPHIVNESILLQSFIQIPKKKNAIFDDVLYVFHKDALLAPLITVRRSTIEDLQNGQFLYAHMSQAAQIEIDALESIKSLTSNKIAFTVLCQDTIIGLYILTKDVNLLYYKSHFAIQDFMVLNEHPRNGFSKILYAILNPVFSKYTRYILKELMRLANKTCLYFEIHKDTALPDIFSELILTRNRKFPHLLERKWNHERDPEYMEKFQDLKYIQDGERDPMDEKEAPFSLAMITKKLLSVNKINDNTRIVVVGGSDTGISLIESLLSVRYVNFPHITLLAPGGIRAIHAKTEYSQMKGYSTNYTLVELRNLLLDSRITVIDARMVNIDRKNKTIKLDKQAILPYDVLVLTLGLCDTQLQDMQLVSEGIGKLNEQYGLYPDRTFIKGVYSIDDPYLYDIFAVNKGRDSPIARLARRKRPEDIVLYGRSLHVYSFINGLINRGVKPERIKLVIPPKTFDRKKEFPSNQDRWDYEDLLVWDPPAFEEEAIEEKVHQILVKLGVQMFTNLKLHAFETDKDNHLQVAIFKKYGENGEPIEKKAKAPVEDEDEENEEDHHEHLEGEEGEDEEGEENGEGEEEEEESDEERIPVRMLVTSRTNDIDLSFFYAIHENGLVYNGRLIVKRNFQTTDPAIFAAGRLCEFSQRYKNQAIGTPLRLDKYSGREVGQKLSRSIMEHIGLLTPEVPEGAEEELPTFFMPMGVGGVLPNDLFYYYVRKIEWARPQLTIEAGKNREDIVCDNLQGLLKGHYIKFTFDHNGIIDSVTYLGSEKIVVQSLVAFVGLSEKYLNKLDTRFKDGLIENVSEFLSENWAIALYHEWFSIFRHKTKMEIANKPSIQEIFDKVAKKARKGHYLTKAKYDKLRAKVSLEVTKAIEDGTLDFIRENLNHLPMYYIPDEEFK